MPEIDLKGQKALKNAKVLVVGAGGLGAPVLLYLAAAGIGKVGIVDADTVDISNLHRQVLYSADDLGKLKAICAAQSIHRLNPYVKTETFATFFSSENAIEIVSDYDIIIDGTDNFPTRYLINDVCVFKNKVHVYGSIFRFEGQVSVFNAINGKGTRGPNYRDLFPSPPPPNSIPDCATAGVMGVLPGIIGSIQANECIKIIVGAGEILSGKLLVMDTLDYSVQILKFKKRADNPLTGINPKIHTLIDYDQFCGIEKKTKKNNQKMKTIDVHTLKELIDNKEEIDIIDVRESYERASASIGGQHVPLGQIHSHIDKIANDKKVVFYCRSGIRSANAIRLLNSMKPFDNLYNLEGGIIAWAHSIDPSLQVN